MRRRHQRRRSYIVNRSLQYRFLAIVLVYSLAIVLFLALFLFVPDIVRMKDQGLSLSARAAAADKILTLHARVWPAVIAIICVAGIHSIRSFHKLIGPLHHFRWVFEQVGKGDLSLKVSIRELDYLHREEAALNEMIEALAERLGAIQRAGVDALDSLGRLEMVLDRVSGPNRACSEAIDNHRRGLQRLMHTVEAFRLGNAEEETQNPTPEPAEDRPPRSRNITQRR